MNRHWYYEILEIDANASAEEVVQAYEDLVAAWNPEAFSKSPRLKKKAERKLKKINKAYRKILSSPSCQREGAFSQRKPPSEAPSFSRPSAEPATREKAKNGRQVHAETHPWIRLLARMIDYFLFVLFLRWVHLFDLPLWRSVPFFFSPVVMSFLWVFLEAVLLCVFGATPGKWIFNTEIIDRSLKRPGLWSAFLRSISVWCNGVGTGFFLIAPATIAVSYFRLKKDKLAPWDRLGKFRLIHRKIEGPRILWAFLGVAVLLVLGFYPPDRQIGSTPLDPPAPEVGYKNTDHETDDIGVIAAKPESRQTSIQRKPGLAQTSLVQANSYLLLGRYEDAMEVYQQIILKSPNLAEARYGLGVSYAKRRYYKEAMAELRQAVRLNPEYAEAHHILGLIYLTSGNKDAALAQHRRLVELDRTLADELLIYIENMRNFVETESVNPESSD